MGINGKTDDPGELLDLLDAEGRVVGTVTRGEVHGNPALRHRAVHIMVHNGRGDVFLQKRGGHKRIQPGRWDTSVGGHVPARESWDHAALREVAEELGLTLADADQLNFRYEYVWSNEVETEHIRTYTLQKEGPFKFQRSEIEDGRFWTPAELRKAAGTGLLTPNLEEELRRLGILKPRT